MITILKSLLQTVAVSASIAGTGMLFDLNFLRTFLIATIGQFVIFYIWNSVMGYMLASRIETEETIRLTELSKIGVDVQCAYCGCINYIPIRLDADNEFECNECDKTNPVYVSITTAQQTDIINRDQLSVSSYISDKVKTVKEVRDKSDDE